MHARRNVVKYYENGRIQNNAGTAQNKRGII